MQLVRSPLISISSSPCSVLRFLLPCSSLDTQSSRLSRTSSLAMLKTACWQSVCKLLSAFFSQRLPEKNPKSCVGKGYLCFRLIGNKGDLLTKRGTVEWGLPVKQVHLPASSSFWSDLAVACVPCWLKLWLLCTVITIEEKHGGITDRQRNHDFNLWGCARSLWSHSCANPFLSYSLTVCSSRCHQPCWVFCWAGTRVHEGLGYRWRQADPCGGLPLWGKDNLNNS